MSTAPSAAIQLLARMMAQRWSNGGGISNRAILAMTNSTLSTNFATQFGGGVSNEGILALANTTVSNNIACNEDGGGIHNGNGRTFEIVNTILKTGTAGAPTSLMMVGQSPLMALTSAMMTAAGF